MYRSFGQDFVHDSHHRATTFDTVCATVDIGLFTTVTVWLRVRSKSARIKTGAINVEKVIDEASALAKHRVSVVEAQVVASSSSLSSTLFEAAAAAGFEAAQDVAITAVDAADEAVDAVERYASRAREGAQKQCDPRRSGAAGQSVKAISESAAGLAKSVVGATGGGGTPQTIEEKLNSASKLEATPEHWAAHPATNALIA